MQLKRRVRDAARIEGEQAKDAAQTRSKVVEERL